jgi:uncharacterized membrane protein
MKRSFLSTVTLLACAALASAAYAAYDSVATAYARVKTFVMEGVAVVGVTAEKPQSAPVVFLVQAKAFVMRLAKRERPVLTTTWRMCPSI